MDDSGAAILREMSCGISPTLAMSSPPERRARLMLEVPSSRRGNKKKARIRECELF